MLTLTGKVAILPCTGVGQVGGSIARQATYRVCEDVRPDNTVILCLPALVKGVQEDIAMTVECPVVVIEGCDEHCATYALKQRGAEPAAIVPVLEVIRGRKLRIRHEKRRALTEQELEAVALVTERVVAEVDRLRHEKQP